MFSISWSGDNIPRNVDELETKTQRAITAAFHFQGDKSTTYMKGAAPWHDRTGAARAGLHSQVNGGPPWDLILAHAVSYGIWLEVAHSGKYQIILPSLRLAMEELKALIDNLWSHL